MKRITVIVGHYGSGKTEFAINYALHLAHQGLKTALVDLDIANPYFRSRERQEFLEEEGIALYSNAFGRDITSDLPALDPGIRAPLEDKSYHVVLDAGGDGSGARILIQYRKYLTDPEETEILFILNGNRPETDTAEKNIHCLKAIEAEIGLPINGLVNNTHMLRETTSDDLDRGMELAREVSGISGIPIKYHSIAKERMPITCQEDVFPLTLYMRPKWLDR